MTDLEWEQERDKRRKLCKDGDLRCSNNYVPFIWNNSKIPTSFIQREYLESCKEVEKNPEYQLQKKKLDEAMARMFRLSVQVV